MPTKRGITVARIPAKRLPLGTPAISVTNIQQTASRTRQKLSPEQQQQQQQQPPTMSTSDVSDMAENATALAQAKLRRQQERIHQAEVALHHPVVERPRPEAHGTGKPIRKPLEIGDRFTRYRQESDGGVELHHHPYAASRDPSLSRSMSSVSQQTNMNRFGAFELNRQDSMDDDSGFQLWTRRGRRVMKGLSEVGTDGGKVNEKQKTVEASYDKREMLQVFKQELPSPEFLTTTPGLANGQIQFVQHPNGDVAAHMWSASNWMWDNIGHFSNIRKRTEGQLAGERLKGETAYQKLQQHTLAYFRVLAKQREASVSGASFGQDDIKLALSEPKDVPRLQIFNEATSKQPTAYVPPPARNDDPFRTASQGMDLFHAFDWQPTNTGSTGHARYKNPTFGQFARDSSDRGGQYEIAPDSTPTREALRDQLHKTVDIATKRSLSQANIARTVLYDPMQASDHDEEHFQLSPTAMAYPHLGHGQPSAHALHSQPAQSSRDFATESVPDINDQASTALQAPQIDQLAITDGEKKKSYDVELREWWSGGSKFSRQDELFRTIMNSAPKPARSFSTSTNASTRPQTIGSERSTSSSIYNEDMTRILIPVYENLASYVQGPPEQRRDYWSRWSKPPEWCIDHGPNGNNSFFDNSWGQPPARVGRDPRYRRDRGELQFGGLSPMSSSVIGNPGPKAFRIGSRFGYGRY